MGCGYKYIRHNNLKTYYSWRNTEAVSCKIPMCQVESLTFSFIYMLISKYDTIKLPSNKYMECLVLERIKSLVGGG